LPNE